MILELPCGHAYDTELEVKVGPNTRGKHQLGDRVHDCRGLRGNGPWQRHIISAEQPREITYTVKPAIHPDSL